MTYLIGTDEAGYGPNLGPLVISATVWRVPMDVHVTDLYGRLSETVTTRPPRAGAERPLRVAIADSKALYPSSKGLRYLETGVWTALGAVGRCPMTWQDLWDQLAPGASVSWPSIPWYAGYNVPVPLAVSLEEIALMTTAFQAGLAAAGIHLVEMRSRVIFEEEFNQLIDHHGSKGAALSHATLQLVSNVSQPLGDEPISVVCDKHGGRNCYQDLLGEHFAEWLIEIYGESRERSVYRFGPRERRMEFTFQTKAESLLPAALASMASKYLRELAMDAFNAFWCGRVPGLQRTAGYPQDARRFKTQIAPIQTQLGIQDRQLWRTR